MDAYERARTSSPPNRPLRSSETRLKRSARRFPTSRLSALIYRAGWTRFADDISKDYDSITKARRKKDSLPRSRSFFLLYPFRLQQLLGLFQLFLSLGR